LARNVGRSDTAVVGVGATIGAAGSASIGIATRLAGPASTGLMLTLALDTVVTSLRAMVFVGPHWPFREGPVAVVGCSAQVYKR
jgi:hypothetical protein